MTKKKEKPLMTKEEAITALEVFSDRVDILKGFSLIRSMSKDRLHLNITHKSGAPLEINSNVPDFEALCAFVCIFRIFIQENDRISMCNVAKIYKKLIGGKDLQSNFVEAYEHFNAILDSQSDVNIGDKKRTNREILEVYVYGGIAHTNQEEFQDWKLSEVKEAFATFMVCGILGRCFELILYIAELNKEAINELQR